MEDLNLGVVAYALENAVETDNGNAVRNVVRNVGQFYEGNRLKLRQLFDNDNKFVRAAATSAYAMNEGDFTFISREEFGGLGIEVANSPKGLIADKSQYMFAKGVGRAFKGLRSFGDAGYKIIGEQKAFEGISARGRSFAEAEGHGTAFRRGRFNGTSGESAKGFGMSFAETTGREESLAHVIANDSSFARSNGYDQSFKFITKEDDSFEDFTAHGRHSFSLRNAQKAIVTRVYA